MGTELGKGGGTGWGVQQEREESCKAAFENGHAASVPLKPLARSLIDEIQERNFRFAFLFCEDILLKQARSERDRTMKAYWERQGRGRQKKGRAQK
eukprot:2034495-Pleurochrysis_carterae.AAC.1